MKNVIFLLFLLTLFIIYLISSHIKNLRQLNESANNIFGIETVFHKYLDLNDEKAMEREYKKIQHYESIERNPVRHLDLFEIEPKIRSLEESNIIYNEISFVTTLNKEFPWTYGWVQQGLGRYGPPSLYVYPYPFSYINNLTKKYSYPQGVYFSTDIDFFKTTYGAKTDSPFQFYRARSLSYSDIAILSIIGDYQGRNDELFQDAIDWCTYLKNKIGLVCYESFELYHEEKLKNSSKFYSSKINETSISQGELMIGSIPRFKALIIPDYKLGTDEIIKSKLGEKGEKEILKYYENGGIIVITGKSGTLFEDFGLIQKGTYDRKRLFSIQSSDRKVGIVGCEELYNKPYNSEIDDFEKRMICMSYFDDRRIGLSTTFKTIKKDGSFNTLIELNSTDNKLALTDIQNGLAYPLSEEEKKYNPLILHKSNNKNGQLFILNYNPLFKGTDIVPTFNTLMLIFTNELFIKSSLTVSTLTGEEIIPAGEPGVEIGVDSTLQNLFDKEINNIKIYLFIANNMGWSTIPSGCTKKSDISNIPNSINDRRSFESSVDYLLCEYEKIHTFDKINLTSKILILNYAATQMKEKVDLLDIIVSFKDYKNREIIMADYRKADCQSPSIIRVALNLDPLGYYPVTGKGIYKDNSIKIENKGEGEAFNVEYIGIFPIISPLVDHSIQDSISYSLKLYVDYYNSNNYYIPFVKNTIKEDLVNTDFLNNKGIHLSLDWDEPVQISKIIDTEGKVEEPINIVNIENSGIKVNSNLESIRQINYKHSDQFYKIAYQRLIAFIDDTTPEGAKAFYINQIPIDILDPVFKDRAKTDFIFMRQDLYYYDEENYIYPEGINSKIIFSIDRLKKYENKNGCAEKYENIKKNYIEKGYYTNREEDKKATIIKPTIWENSLFDLCDLTVINPTNEEEIKKQFGNLDSFKPVHYIYRNTLEHISQPGQMMNFVTVNKYYGYHKDYPEIKFLYLHTSQFILENIYCIYGGKIIINIKDYSIENASQVTISPDQIAVYNVSYIDGNITIYFKRGLMSNEQYGKNMNLTINIEGLQSQKSETFKLIIEELKYDFSNHPDYEKYYFVLERKVEFNYNSAFSLPALQVKSKLNRILNGYETIEPFARFGIHQQEIYHRTVFSPGEAHYINEPGITQNKMNMNSVSHLGIHPIPFVEYMTTGLIPYTPPTETTSRIMWKDVWGRTWYQPMRSTYCDFVIVPPPVKNLVMTTTFELLRNGNQILEWPSDENIQIHLHIKLLNNYLKHWDIIRCYKNNIRYIPNELGEVFLNEQREKIEEELKDEELKGDNMFITQGNYGRYGVCYYDKRTVVRGKNVTNEILEKLKNATICAESRDITEIEQCLEKLKDIPTVNKSPEDWNMTELWNYSPLVESFYPENYINNEMWTMNSYEYEDNEVNKAYRGHLDNVLPNYDNKISKTRNTIAVPIYKGLGYNITYDLNNQMNYHGKIKKGWWCDNLQNKDDTLLAGQDKSNQISVDKNEEITWIDGIDLVGSTRKGSDEKVKEIINNRTKNIYSCLFNRRRPQIKKDCKKIFFSSNICENNVVPILVDLEKNDPRLYNYKCDREQYTPDNIHEEKGNLLITPSDKDYLYFAANIRAGAKESFNILMNLNYFSKVKYEGMVKINEGSRFVYWNPGWGENSYMVYDDPVSIINAKRNDIIIDNIVIPRITTTFNAIVYHLYTFKDESKINKEWPYKLYYQNSYGFGDVSVSVSVGGIKNSKPILQPGETTYARIIFYNNCGFDWNMKRDAIDFIYNKSKVINAQDLMRNIVHTIREPISYNFLEYIIEDRYKEYIDIKPSNHNSEISPEFFDFGYINVVTIRDGFKGEYNLQINVTSDFPDSLRGKPIEIKINLNTSYFDCFPGTNTDPTNPNKYHTYQVKIPSIYIAVPFRSGEFKGKVLYTSSQAKITSFSLYNTLESQTEGKYVDKEFVNKFINASKAEEPLQEIENLWNTLKNQKSLEVNEIIHETNKQLVFPDIAKDYPYFPKKLYGEPDQAEVSILLRSHYSQLDMRTAMPIWIIRLYYSNWLNKGFSAIGEVYPIQAKGAWIDISYSRSLVDYISDDIYIERTEQELSPADEGIMKIQFKLENIGNGDSYNTLYQILISENVTYFSHRKGINKISEEKKENGETLLTFDLNSPINAGEIVGGIIYLKYKKLIDKEQLETSPIKQLPSELLVAKESSVIIDLTNKKGENVVVQNLKKTLSFVYTIYEPSSVYIDLVISGKRKNPTVKIVPKIKCKGNDTLDNIKIKIIKNDLTKYSSNENNTEYKEITLYSKGKFTKDIKDKPNKIENSNKEHVSLYTIYVYTNDGFIYNQIEYIQKDIGISTTELVLIILSIIFYAASIFMIYLSVKKCKNLNSSKDFNKDINDSKIEELLNQY